MQFTYLAVLHNKSHNGSDKYCTSKNNCIDQNSLKSMCFDLAWPDLSSAQGVIAFSISARSSAGAYIEMITPCGEVRSGQARLLRLHACLFNKEITDDSFVQAYLAILKFLVNICNCSVHFIIKRYGGMCCTNLQAKLRQQKF